MKTINKILIATLLVLPFLFSSCQEDLMVTDLGNTPLELSASANDIILDVMAPKNTALTFSWTSGSNFNTNSKISYSFELALEGTNFENALVTELDQGKNSVIYTTEELNKILLNEFAIEENENASLEARVTANVHSDGIEPQVSEIVKISVTSYKPVTQTLYLIGSAAPNGWSADDATPMNIVAGSAGSFVWQGKLKAGELKFITTLGEFLPTYNKGADDNTLFYRESDDQADDKFEIAATGIYKIAVNVIDLTISIEALDAPEFGELWFVGNPTGWSFVPMTVDPLDPFIFYYNADLKDGGEFKIATQPDFDDSIVFLRPEENGQAEGTDLNVVKWSQNENGDDHKWNVEGSVYKIKLDIRDMKIDIVPFEPFETMYMVGDATPNGWDIGNATPMEATDDPYVFTWSGSLSDGEMKFSAEKQDDWNGAWFLATSDGATPTGSVESMLFSYPGSNPDNKWRVSAGSYTIELNQLQETVIFKKQ